MARRNRNLKDIPLQAELMLRHPLFAALATAEREHLLTFAELRHFAAGETLIEEGQTQEWLCVLLAGKACIARKDDERGAEVVLTSIGPGALVGENAALLGRPAMASVVAEAPGTLACLNVRRLRETPGTDALWLALLEGAAQELATKLEEAGTRSLSYYRWQLTQLQDKRVAGSFTLRTLSLLGLYALVSALPTGLEPSSPIRVLFSTLLIGLCAGATATFIRTHKLKPEDFGLGLGQVREKVTQALGYTLPLMLAVLALRPLVLGARAAGPLFAPGWERVGQHAGMLALLTVGLLLLSLAQEFVVRAGIQGALQIFYTEDRFSFPWKAIAVTNLLFAASYAHLGPLWPLLAFVPGLFWGWLYARQNSLASVTASHALLSIWSLLVLGIPLG